MGQERGHFRDEFKTEAIALLAGSGRRLVEIAGELGISPSMLRNWRNRQGGSKRGRRCPRNRRRPCLALRIGRRRSPGFAARTIGCAWSATFQERLWRSSRKRRDEVRPDRGSAGCLAGARPVRCTRRVSVRLLCMAITAGKPARDRQSRTAGRYPAGSCRAPGKVWGTTYSCRAACRGPECRPQAGRAGDAPAWHPGSRAASLSCVHHRQQAFSADRGHPARPEFRGREAGSEPAPAKAGVWLADITDILTGEGWLYLAGSPDRFTRKIVGWARREHVRAELTIAALTMAVQRRRLRAGLIHHADRGSHYAAGDYRNIPQAAAITPSMSRKPNCWDNAPMESVFGTLKSELVHQREYPDRDAARRDLFASIEAYYNRRRIHSAIGYIIPEQADRKTV